MKSRSIIFAVPYDWRRVGGLYLPISMYSKHLEKTMNVIEFPMQYRMSKGDIRSVGAKLQEIYADREVVAVISYGINASYYLSQMLSEEQRKHHVCMIMDSMFWNNISSIDWSLRALFQKDNLKKIVRLPVYYYREQIICAREAQAVYVSRWDADKVREGYRNIKAKIAVVPNGVSFPAQIEMKTHNREHKLTFGMLGTWTDEYVEHCILPFVNWVQNMPKDQQDRIEVVLAGRNITQDHRNKLAEYKYVNVIGETAELKDFYDLVDVVFTTMKKKSGILNKVLEAFAYGKTVLGFRDNFYAILGTEDRQNCLFCDTQEEFDQLMDRILSGEIDIDAIGLAARAMVLSRYNWDDKGTEIERLIEELS